jgi:hypothetical protein
MGRRVKKRVKRRVEKRVENIGSRHGVPVEDFRTDGVWWTCFA